MYAWGARADENDVVPPGDDLVSASTPRRTRAVSIDASIEAVWPWLVQIGETAAASTAMTGWNGRSAHTSTTRTSFIQSGRNSVLATRSGWPGGMARGRARWLQTSSPNRIW